MKPTFDGNVFTGGCRRGCSLQRVHGKRLNYKTLISSDLIRCCVWMSYSSITSHCCQISFFHSQLKPMTVKENGRGCKPHQSFMYRVVELDKAPSFFHIPPKKMGFSYSFSFETQPFKPPFCINSTKPDNTESFTSFTPSPSPFSQVHFPKLKLHYTAILLSRGKVIIFRCCRHPLSVV